jgi:hypothetical protein
MTAVCMLDSWSSVSCVVLSLWVVWWFSCSPFPSV